MPEWYARAFKVTIGTKMASGGISYDGFGEIVYKGDEFVVGSVADRARQEWYNVLLKLN
jgi:hypothetical protein